MAWDAIVAGAGPAGAVAARRLLQAGWRVLLIDPGRGRMPRIGEALPGLARPLLRSLGLPAPGKGGPHRPIRGNLSAWGSAELIPTDFLEDPHGMGWRLDRTQFDETLKSAAISAGAILQTSALVAAVRKGGQWRCEFDDGGEAQATWLVDATGRASIVARALGIKRRRGPPLVALYSHGARTVTQHSDRTLVESVRQGWWYAAWLPSGAPIAALHVGPAEAARVLRTEGEWHRAFRATRHARTLLAGAIFPNRPYATDASPGRLERFAGRGWLACGDAAVSFDPLSAQGIYFALWSAKLAAENMLGTGRGTTAAIDRYAAHLDSFYAVVTRRLAAAYANERRWRNEKFWSMRIASGLSSGSFPPRSRAKR